MSMRRRYLMAIVDSEKYIDNVFNYVHYSLMTSNRAKGKTMLSKIEGNGVIENQLIVLNSRGSFSGLDCSVDTNGVWTINGTTSEQQLNTYLQSGNYTRIPNRKYLYVGRMVGGSIDTSNKTTTGYNNGYMFTANLDNFGNFDFVYNKVFTKIIDNSSSSTSAQFVRIGFDANVVFNNAMFIFELFDLTQMFGTGNEPTSTSDNRIQEILNRGYIPYNAGEYRETTIKDISTYTYAPQLVNAKSLVGKQNNLTQGSGELYNWITLYSGGWRYYTVEDGNTQFYIPINSTNKKYALIIKFNRLDLFGDTALSLANGNRWNFSVATEYRDTTNNIIVDVVTNNTQTSLIECLRVANGQSLNGVTVSYFAFLDLDELGLSSYSAEQLFNLLGVDAIERLANGDALDDKLSSIVLPAPMTLGGAINSHNTFAVTPSGYTFTRNVWKADLGSLSYAYNNSVFSTDIGNIKTQANDVVVNALCPLYLPVTRNDFVTNTPNMTMRVDNNQSTPYLYFRNNAYTSSTDFKTAMSGVYIHYELSTPQIITIPKNHLSCVDLGTLTYLYVNNNNRSFFIAEIQNIKPSESTSSKVNAYCNLYYVKSWLDAFVDKDMSYYGSTTGSTNLVFVNNDYTNATDFKNAMSGVYLFYETDQPVQDFENKGKFVNNGTITGLTDFATNYQQVEYIESTGSQYINTGYDIKSEKLGIKAKIRIVNASGQYGSLFGSDGYVNGSNLYSLVPYHNSSYGEMVYRHWLGTSQGNDRAFAELSEFEYRLDNGKVYFSMNGTVNNFTYSGSIVNNQNFYIFGKNGSGSSMEIGTGYKLYYFKLYDNDNLVRDFIPCYRKSDNVIGLYDLLNKVFYANSGSGTFNKGNDVSNTLIDCEVLPNITMKMQS